jgi:hypothetical protein
MTPEQLIAQYVLSEARVKKLEDRLAAVVAAGDALASAQDPMWCWSFANRMRVEVLKRWWTVSGAEDRYHKAAEGKP